MDNLTLTNRQKRQVEQCVKIGIVRELFHEQILTQRQLEMLMEKYQENAEAWGNEA